MNALQALCQLADARKANRHPNFPAKYIPKSKYSDRDANGLTTCVVDFLNLSGHFATRLASTGTYRADIERYVPSQQRSGMPDVLAVVDGQAVFIEVKAGKDRLSDRQKQTHHALENAGALVYTARNFDAFYGWFLTHFTENKKADVPTTPA